MHSPPPRQGSGWTQLWRGLPLVTPTVSLPPCTYKVRPRVGLLQLGTRACRPAPKYAHALLAFTVGGYNPPPPPPPPTPHLQSHPRLVSHCLSSFIDSGASESQTSHKSRKTFYMCRRHFLSLMGEKNQPIDCKVWRDVWECQQRHRRHQPVNLTLISWRHCGPVPPDPHNKTKLVFLLLNCVHLLIAVMCLPLKALSSLFKVETNLVSSRRTTSNLCSSSPSNQPNFTVSNIPPVHGLCLEFWKPN